MTPIAFSSSHRAARLVYGAEDGTTAMIIQRLQGVWRPIARYRCGCPIPCHDWLCLDENPVQWSIFDVMKEMNRRRV
jgi:hypothetical protein